MPTPPSSPTFAWEPPGATGLVLLVHGLGADAAETWGPDEAGGGFLGRLLRQPPTYAVACYEYPSRLGLPGRHALPALTTLAAAFGATLRDEVLPAYERVAVVAYCLGGLVAHFALTDLLTGAPEALAAGQLMVVLLDSPEDWPDGPLDGSMGAVARMLQVDEPALSGNARWWSDRAGPAALVEAHAVVSSDDCWVTPFKPGSTAPAGRVLHSGIPHLDLVRPPATGPHETYDHVAALMARHLR